MHGIDATLEMLNEAVKLLPDKEITAKLDYVKQLRPVAFDFEKYLDVSGSHLASGEENEDGAEPVNPFWYGTGYDIYDNEHDNTVAIYWLGDNSGNDSCTLSYKMTGEYDKLTGKMYIPFGNRKTDSRGEISTKLEVWGDGEKITSVVAKNTEGLVEFSVDISEVNLLELKFFSQMWFYRGSFLFGSGYNFIGFCDVKLEKNY